MGLAWRLAIRGAGAVLRGTVYLLASPVVLMADLVQPDPDFDRAWVVGFMGFLTAAILVTWGFGYLVTVETVEANVLVEEYAEIGAALAEVPYLEVIKVYAARNGLDPALVAAIISQESAFDPDAVSPMGARGLMQILPDTWRLLCPDSSCSGRHAPPACGPDCIFDPEANIRAGTAYFADILDEFDRNIVLAFAAYNAGTGAVHRHAGLQGGRGLEDLPPFAETRAYVRQVLSFWVRLRSGSVPDVAVLTAEECRLLRQLAVVLPVTVLTLWVLFSVWLLRRTWPPIRRTDDA